MAWILLGFSAFRHSKLWVLTTDSSWHNKKKLSNCFEMKDFIYYTKSEYQVGDFKNLNYFQKNSSFYLIDNPCLLSQMFILMLPRRKQYCKTTATAQLTSDLTSQHHFLIWPPFKYAKWGNLGCYRKKSSTIALYAGIYAFQHSANYGASMIIMGGYSLYQPTF